MQHSVKLLINTIASYIKIVLNTLVTIFATRIALKALGAEDFGLYNLVAGIIVLLSFVNGSLMISSQRFFSIAIGEKNENKLHRYFNTSLGIHLMLGICIAGLFLILTPLLFNGFLNIDSAQISNTKNVYYIMIISSLVTIGSIPYSAIMNAHEDMAVLALIDIISCILKFAAAFSLLYISSNLLQWYAFFMMISLLAKMLLEVYWCRKKYTETSIQMNLLYNKSLAKEMLGFVGWNTLGSMAVLVRNQGVAVVLNVFFGTIVNAAYGIANQVNSLVLSFASTLTSVFTPMIIQAKGAGDNERMLQSAILSSKLSFLLSSMMALPILMNLSQILDIWLGEIPEMTENFCFYIVISFLVLQLYPGLNRAIYASGHIKGYQLSISIVLILTIPIGVLLFSLGYPSYSILIVMLLMQIFTLFSTIYYANKHCGLEWKNFLLRSVILPVSIFILCLLVWNLSVNIINELYYIYYSMFLTLAYILIYYIFIFTNGEQELFKRLMSLIKNKR